MQRDFLRSYGIPEASVDTVWDAIALHTRPGIPEHKKAEVALLIDVLAFKDSRFQRTDFCKAILASAWAS
jgi:hypothetical protein